MTTFAWLPATKRPHVNWYQIITHQSSFQWNALTFFYQSAFLYLGEGARKKNRQISSACMLEFVRKTVCTVVMATTKNKTCSQTRTQKEAQRQIFNWKYVEIWMLLFCNATEKTQLLSVQLFIFLLFFFKRSSSIGPTFVLFPLLPTPCHLFFPHVFV